MTRIDFYICKPESRENRHLLACKIAEKAWQRGQRVLVHTSNEAETRHVDRLLWVFKEQSFIPHGVLDQDNPKINPILIGHQKDPGNEHEVLINLAAERPDFFSRFERLAECVDQEPGIVQAARDRYRYYRDNGYVLETHDIR